MSFQNQEPANHDAAAAVSSSITSTDNGTALIENDLDSLSNLYGKASRGELRFYEMYFDSGLNGKKPRLHEPIHYSRRFHGDPPPHAIARNLWYLRRYYRDPDDKVDVNNYFMYPNNTTTANRPSHGLNNNINGAGRTKLEKQGAARKKP